MTSLERRIGIMRDLHGFVLNKSLGRALLSNCWGGCSLCLRRLGAEREEEYGSATGQGKRKIVNFR